MPSPLTAVAAASSSACEPHRTFIEAQLRLRRNATAIYQDLVEHRNSGTLLITLSKKNLQVFYGVVVEIV